MTLENAKGLLLSMVDDRCAEHGTAELEIHAAIAICQMAIRYAWLKEHYDLVTNGVESLPLQDEFVNAAMRAP
jgi:hypothetical protein